MGFLRCLTLNAHHENNAHGNGGNDAQNHVALGQCCPESRSAGVFVVRGGSPDSNEADNAVHKLPYAQENVGKGPEGIWKHAGYSLCHKKDKCAAKHIVQPEGLHQGVGAPEELFEKEINITALTSPEKIEKNEKLSLFIHRNHIVENKAVALSDTTIELKGFDLIITAIGSRAEKAMENEKIIMAGDCKEGSSTLVEALASGQKAAQKLIYNIEKKDN